MHLVRISLCIFLLSLPLMAVAELSGGDLPAARWYAHADLVEMRSSDAGMQLYVWLEDEVFDQLREKVGYDADREANSITAVATPEGGVLVVIDGDFSQKTQDGLLAVGATASEFNMLKHDGKAYYQINDDDRDDEPDSDEENGDEENSDDVDSFENGAFMSLAIKDKLIVTSTEVQMQNIIDSNGRIPGAYDDGGALMVLRGAKSFLQAGMQTNEFSDDLGWDSNMLRNTEQLALLVSDVKGMLAIEAQLVATEEEMANSLASIVRGLISLQAFSDDIDPELSQFLNDATVSVDGSTLTVKVAVDPEVLVVAID